MKITKLEGLNCDNIAREWLRAPLPLFWNIFYNTNTRSLAF